MSKKRNKRKHKQRRKNPTPTATHPTNPLKERMELINTMKPVIATAKRTAARQRERKQERDQGE